ncbi:MAG: UPF0182 family protein [Gemmatimonadetes bacterium]|nr:UPF0182 family protein [Gemmatimonadota bacterium]
MLAPPMRRIPRRNRRSAAFVLFGVILAVLFVLPGMVRFFVDLLWFQEIGFERVFFTELRTKFLMFAGVGAFAFAFVYLNLRLAQRGLVFRPVLIPSGSDAPPIDVTATLQRLSFPVALAISGLVGLGAMSGWMLLLQALNAVRFGAADPVFGRDISFYVFTLPPIAAGIGLLFALTLITLLLVVALYWVRRDIIPLPRGVRVEPSAGMHLGTLAALLFVLTAVGIWVVRLPELLYSTTGPLVGASYTDLYASLPALHVRAVAALLAAGIVMLGATRRRLASHLGVAVAGYVGISLLAGGVYPAAIQRLIVGPTELTRETPYLTRHIAATRQAWGLDDVETRDLSGESVLTVADIQANAATIDNVRLWDRAPLLQTFGQLQEIRTYYDFVSVDDGRYWIDGKYRQVLLSPRELNPASLPTRTFINEHLTFTHGMGLTLGPVNQVTEEGLPVLFIKDLPPVSSVSLRVTRPQIYFGELTNSHVFTGTRQREFDYPSGEANIFTRYAGTGGVPMGSLPRRALMAAHFGSLKILLSQDITSETRVLYRRNVMERAQRALPFLRFDADPYMVITANGELRWMLDAYTTSSRYPYAQRLGDGTNYMRNSVKVVIDAYHGSLQAFVSDAADPVVRTYSRIFPGIFQPLSAMPADLLAHIRYPEDLYRIQTAMHTVYHMDEPETFYNREDQWQIPMMGQGQREAPFMRRIVMRLPDEERAEYIFMTPFTPRQKDNLASWMVARSDAEHYGKLVVYRFPKQSLIFGPQQVVNRINQDTEIARQISLWDQRGSQVIRGELLVIPIEESLLYVQPIYLRAEGGRIPELKRVVVAYQNRVVMEETFDEALGLLFAGAGERPADAPAATPAASPATPEAGAAPATVAVPQQTDAALISQAQAHYDRAMAALRAGNWTQYGAEIERLGQILRRMNANSPGQE